MKSVIFDFITGAAIIMGLVIVADVMKANQMFIDSSAQTETDVEQLYIGSFDEEAGDIKENTYTVADVYGTLTTLTKLDGTLMDKYEIRVIASTEEVWAKGDEGTFDEKKAGVENLKNLLTPMLDNPNSYKFKRTKSQKVNSWKCSNPECTQYNGQVIAGNKWSCPVCGQNKMVDSTVIIYEFRKY